MTWTVIPFSPNYQISEHGVVRNAQTGKELRPCVLKRGGYLAVSLWQNNKGKTWPIHQIVAITFHGERPSPLHHAAHRDGNKGNNHKANVQWLTKAENEADKILHGTDNSGARNGSAKLSSEIISSIRKLHSQGLKQKQIGERFGVEQSHLSRIISNQLWKDV